MRGAFVFTLSVFICCSAVAQKRSNTADYDKVFTKVEISGGPDTKQWTAYIKRSSLLPAAVTGGIPAGGYKITVHFIIDSQGNLVDVKAKNNPGYGLAKKAEDIILNYDGIWHPANQCGRNVKSYKEEIIQFIVGD